MQSLNRECLVVCLFLTNKYIMNNYFDIGKPIQPGLDLDACLGVRDSRLSSFISLSLSCGILEASPLRFLFFHCCFGSIRVDLYDFVAVR